ncbi:HAD-like domain-containing protein [Phycomyces nitens]|nr:HAD-like domain-containing protein [Phycomyces nitens]
MFRVSQRLGPLVLVDFDQTITIKDTIELLANTALRLTKSKLTWDYFVDAYMRDYDKVIHKTFLDPTAKEHALAKAEQNSLTRVTANEVFKGLKRQDLLDAGRREASRCLRPGVIDALKQISPSDQLHIVSLNWSKDWILGFLDPLGLSQAQIHCNDLVYGKDGLSTGVIEQRILTTRDKQREMDHIVRQSQHTSTVYIGDSLGDLLPLINADIGVIIGNNQSLADAIRQHGFSLEPLSSNANKKSIYCVDNWDEIKDSMLLSSGHV